MRGGHLDEGSVAKAEASLRAVLKSNPEFAPAYDTLAYVLTLPGSHQNLDEAYTMTLRAEEREPGNVYYNSEWWKKMEAMGRADDAIRVATRAASMAKTPEERESSVCGAGGRATNPGVAEEDEGQAESMIEATAFSLFSP